MRGDGWVQIGALTIALAAGGASIGLTNLLAGSVGRNKLTYGDTAERGATWQVGMGVSLGVFRGIFINSLWVRANQAKEQGNFYEAMDLARAIVTLQPRMGRVWAFHAWNMAYNVSVECKVAEERWHWVNAGIRILRDEGIPNNPHDLHLYRELAWIHLHKVQGTLDDANWYYKRAFADEWTVVFGPPRWDATHDTREKRIKVTVERLAEINAAPETIDELIARDEALSKADPQRPLLARRLVDFLKQNVQLDVTVPTDQVRLLRSAERLRVLGRIPGAVEAAAQGADAPIIALFTQPNLQPALGLLMNYLRKRVLVDQYRMNIDWMIECVNRHGPLDWRHPAAHAVYWASLGHNEVSQAVSRQNRRDFDFINNARIINQALQELFRFGNIQFDMVGDSDPIRSSLDNNPAFFDQDRNYITFPNMDFARSYRDFLEKIKEIDDGQMKFIAQDWGWRTEERAYTIYQAGYENFMRDAIAYLYTAGERAQAEEFRQILIKDQREGRLNANNPELTAELELPLDQFVLKQIRERLTSPNVALQQMEGPLRMAYLLGVLRGNEAAFREGVTNARNVHEYYWKEQNIQTWVNPDRARMEIVPRDFADLQARVVAQLIATVTSEDASLIYNRAPTDVRVRVYDAIVAMGVKNFTDGRAQGRGTQPFDMLFPKPDGLDEYRALQQAKRAQRDTKAEVDR